MCLLVSRCHFSNNLKFGLSFCYFFLGTFYHTLGPYEVKEEKDAEFYDVSLKITLIFMMNYCKVKYSLY